VAATDAGIKRKYAQLTKPSNLPPRLPHKKTNSSNLFDSLLFYLIPLLCLLPDYLTPTFPLSGTIPDSCPGTVDASHIVKLNQQKPSNFTYLFLPYYLSPVKKKSLNYKFFPFFYFV
jgi:hypothetical protein